MFKIGVYENFVEKKWKNKMLVWNGKMNHILIFSLFWFRIAFRIEYSLQLGIPLVTMLIIEFTIGVAKNILN